MSLTASLEGVNAEKELVENGYKRAPDLLDDYKIRTILDMHCEEAIRSSEATPISRPYSTGVGDVVGHVTRPAFSGVEGDDTSGAVILALE